MIHFGIVRPWPPPELRDTASATPGLWDTGCFSDRRVTLASPSVEERREVADNPVDRLAGLDFDHDSIR